MKANLHVKAAAEIDAREAFVRDGHAILPELLDQSVATFLWSYAHVRFASLMLGGGDSQVPRSPCAYADPAFEALLEFLRPAVERASGCALLPTYSYLRIYKHGDRLERHRDRRACEISVSINIGQEAAEPWPLQIDGKSGRYAAVLAPGDGLLYRGVDHYHWRDRFEGRRYAQVFLHYVDRNGPNADCKFDGRKSLMLPRQGETEDGAR
jgi:hypothetical protein